MGVPASDEHAMIEFLDASGPNEEHAEALMLFGQFVGSWDVEVTYFDREGNVTDERLAEWHCGWVMQGQAIQDVWISPPLEEQRRTGTPGLEYGMQFRMYQPQTDTWRVVWFDLVSATIIEVVGRAVGEEIVLEGADPDGTLYRRSCVTASPRRIPSRREPLRRNSRDRHPNCSFPSDVVELAIYTT